MGHSWAEVVTAIQVFSATPGMLKPELVFSVMMNLYMAVTTPAAALKKSPAFAGLHNIGQSSEQHVTHYSSLITHHLRSTSFRDSFTVGLDNL